MLISQIGLGFFYKIIFPCVQVDMKIMYYELIKMLIDYERKNHPESYDATKTVGKIEGYQVQDI